MKSTRGNWEISNDSSISRMKNTILFSSLVLLLFVEVSGQCPSDERSLLLQLKKSLNFSATVSGWNQTSRDCCTWTGVHCEEGHVAKLTLYDGIISGSLNCSSSLLNLKYLNTLDLSNNNIDCSTILSCICNLNKLEILYLPSTCLTGRIPSFHKCKLLTEVELRNNFLNGSIPTSLLSHPSLQKIWLQNNQLSGQVHEFPNASSSRLQSLSLRGNKLEGHVPMSTFKLMTQLRFLSLSFNKFNGTIEKDVTQGFDNLNYLDLSYNNLSIELASDSFRNITQLMLASCKLGKFPPLKNRSNVMELDVSNNEIYGEIPNWIWQIGTSLTLNFSCNKLVGLQQPYSLANVIFLDLHKNHLTGNIPTLSRMVFIDLSYNNFTSSIPMDIGSILRVVDFFSLSNNQITGVIPESICYSPMMHLLDLSDNNLSGPIPSCIFDLWQLKVLDLQRNKLSGQIPDIFSEGYALNSLYLNGNSIEGHIPPSLANCLSLRILDLGNNNMVGSFPCFLKKISTLQVLVLRSNYFNGRIGCPDQYTNETWSMLQIVDLAHNNFKGELLGGFFKNWQAMMVEVKAPHVISVSSMNGSVTYQDAVEVIHKSQETELVRILNAYTSFDLSGNNFEGSIPEELGELRSLRFLNLSHNSFRGPIPSSLGNLKELESFDLSVNQLSGEIPTSLAKLNFLAVLNLSNNQLEGKIPTGSQLQLFSADSFVGNKGLCGPPLTMNCSYPDDSIDDASGADIDWNIIAAVIGFIFGFGFITLPLLLCNRWRKLYFERVEDFAYWIIPLTILRKWWSWKTQRKRG